MEEVFSASAVTLFPDVIEDGHNGVIDPEIDPDDITIDRIVCVNIGQTILRPHLIVSRLSIFYSENFLSTHFVSSRFFSQMAR